ncbi:unnamed protein product, partial [Tenebrio molitor]
LLEKTLFSDEAWFHLSGYVNSQNMRIWSTENPHVYVEAPLHPQKIGFWTTVNYVHLVINNFNHSSGNLTAVRYQQVILEPFINQLHDDESALRYFQQDEATAHSARTTITMLREF